MEGLVASVQRLRWERDEVQALKKEGKEKDRLIALLRVQVRPSTHAPTHPTPISQYLIRTAFSSPLPNPPTHLPINRWKRFTRKCPLRFKPGKVTGPAGRRR